MKKLSLLLLLSTSVLFSCQEDKATEAETAVAVPTTAAQNTSDAADAKASAAPTADVEPTGESIHQANCTKCHGSEVYTRADRKVASLEALTKQVRMCDTQLETQLFPEDLDLVVEYLNETHYKF